MAMPIEFPCPKCSAVLRTPDEAAGKKARCPQCGAIADVPLRSVESTVDEPAEAAPTERFPSEPTAGAPNVPAAPDSDLPSLDQQSPFASQPTAEYGSPFEDSPGAGKGKDVDRGAANPYASPDAFSATEDTPFGTAERGMQHSRIDFGEVFSTTWAIFSENLGPCVLVGLIKLGFGFALGVFGQIGNLAADASGEPLAAFGFLAVHLILVGLVTLWANLGILYFAARLVRTRQANIADFFAVGRFYLRGWCVGVIVVFLVQLGSMVCLLPLGGMLAFFAMHGGMEAMEANIVILIITGTIGFLLACAFSAWINLKYFLANVFIVDQDHGILGSLRDSNVYMRGNKGVGFLIMLVVLVIGMPFVACTCQIGSIFFDPYVGILMVVIYLMATGQAFPYRSSQG
jgi:hypothetical protein